MVNIIKYKSLSFKVEFLNVDVRLKLSSIYKLFVFFEDLKKYIIVDIDILLKYIKVPVKAKQ